MTPRRITRRQALADALAAAAAGMLATSCGGTVARNPGAYGSTVSATWHDPAGTGQLERAPGERLIARTELGPAAALEQEIATLAHVTDAHVLDASSPARVTFLDRLGPPFQSTFRPHETLTAQVLAGTVRAIRRLRPDAVIQGGDLIDNDQSNELVQALVTLSGGFVGPGSGPHGYHGVQLSGDADPFYYRPDLDAPRYPGLLQRATEPFWSPGLGARTYPVLGDHDILVQGEIRPMPETKALATGSEALWELPPGLKLPPNAASALTNNSPDGPPRPGVVSSFLAQALAGPKVPVPSDPARREMEPGEVISRVTKGQTRPSLDYRADLAPGLRVIVLDLARRGGGSGGLVRPEQPGWLAKELASAGNRWIIVASHQPLTSSEGGDQLLSLLDQHPKVIAAVSGHIHRNRIEPRQTQAGGYWMINTASLIDYPQQARAMKVVATNGGGVAIQTWMLDHAFPGNLGTISRQLAYLDAQGGRPKNLQGDRLDRNVTLYRARA
jgi:3',5'-cyclic AMP phosphodiesterase CpdA